MRTAVDCFEHWIWIRLLFRVLKFADTKRVAPEGGEFEFRGCGGTEDQGPGDDCAE